ncbi:conserved hypothetical protein [Agrobacterium genomosp. 13 str. CFBP 6927]|uniref:Uncharacterized protein n=1 Tax=Agrobacterium genomosp. 13 str. CFBP 6927 TaxID=1183428 RepID=A0ABM9VLS7_9HYPH|nr:conserved hypothetical protein [Agrobacterium genomosp. 13 str. CFBP 6927]
MAGGGTGAGVVWDGLSGDMSKGEDCATAPAAAVPHISTASELLIVLLPVISRLRQV